MALIYMLAVAGFAMRFFWQDSRCLIMGAVVLWYGIVITTGHVLSSRNAVNDGQAWLYAGIGWLLLSALCVLSQKKFVFEKIAGLAPAIGNAVSEFQGDFQDTNHVFKSLLLIEAVALFVVVGIDLADVLTRFTSNVDSLWYHLPRAAYYLQHGNFRFFHANCYWDVLHLRNTAILCASAYKLTGNWVGGMVLVQYSGFLLTLVEIFIFCRECGCKWVTAILATSVYGLLPIGVLEAVTGQDEFTMTAVTVAAVFFVVRGSQRKSWLHYITFGTALGIGLACKASYISFMLPVLIVAIWGIFFFEERAGSTKDRILKFALGILFGVILFAVPGGYLENWRVTGDPLGGPYVKNMTCFGDTKLSTTLVYGIKNDIRFGFDMLSFDGLPGSRPICLVNAALRRIPLLPADALHLNLSDMNGARIHWDRYKKPVNNADISSFGIGGDCLIFGSCLFALFFPCPQRVRVCAIACIAMVLSQGFVGPYDPWRSRGMLVGVLFSAPCMAMLFSHLRRGSGVVLCALLLLFTAVCGVGAAVLNEYSSWITYSRVVGRNGTAVCTPPAKTDWADQACPPYSLLGLKDVVREYYKHVPSGSTVAAYFDYQMLEFPFFGPHFEYRLIPCNPFDRTPVWPPPKEAQFAIFDDRIGRPASGDIALGWVSGYNSEIWLRRLSVKSN